MLRSLRISQFALIDRLELEFGPGLNIITGETGAGKSIIVDAFLAALGERSSADMIRGQESRAVVEAEFECADSSVIHDFLQHHDCESMGSTLILRRELSRNGKSRFFINDSPTQASILRELGSLLVDFHGQFEHQSILRPEFQLRMLDEVAQTAAQVQAYKTVYRELRELVHTFRELRAQEAELRAKQDFQRAQLDEIERIDPQPLEDEDLERELTLLSNAELLFAQSDAAYQLLYAADTSARDALIKVREHFHQLRSVDERFADSCAELDSLVISVEELAKGVKHYSAGIEFQPQRIEEIRERLVQLQRLRKRYGSLERTLELKERLATELQFIENYEEQTKQYHARIEALQTELGVKAMALSKKRSSAIADLDAAIIAHLRDLGIEHARFETHCAMQKLEAQSGSDEMIALIKGKAYRAFAHGCDAVHFVASMNKGEELKGLDRVLSGGEASRLMLALKSVLAQADHIPLVVFDEIDTGVSGRIARKVGAMMKKLGQSHQVLAITHQAQIASLADRHLAVEKSSASGQTVVAARVLSDKDRITEVAKLISGEEVTAAAIKSARELMKE